jgi:hypothetical protein
MTSLRLFGRSSLMKVGVSALLAPCLLAVFGGGCGGDGGSVSLGPAGKFLGRWQRVPGMSTFRINCPATMISGEALIWPELVFERGTLTDASEASGNCLPPGMSFDVEADGVTLSAPNPDPYTDAPPICTITLGTDTAGLPVFLDFTFSALDFTMLQAVAGQAPSALLSGTAAGGIFQADSAGAYVQIDACTYSGTGDTYYRMSQPDTGS